MKTIRVCLQCNQDKKLLDDYMRDRLLADVATSGNPQAQILVREQFGRAVATNRSVFTREARKGFAHRSLESPSGLLLGQVPTVPIDNRKVDRFLTYVVRGLRYKFGRHYFPLQYAFATRHVEPANVQFMVRIFRELTHANGPYTIGMDVFSCMFAQATEDPATTLWLLLFYNCVMYYVSTGLPMVDHPFTEQQP
jgi:hypothetical protein